MGSEAGTATPERTDIITFGCIQWDSTIVLYELRYTTFQLYDEWRTD